jgi:hypothetical protein
MADEQQTTRVMPIFFGTRADLAPYPMTYVWACESCTEPTYSVAEPPLNHTIVCNVCVSRISSQAEKAPKTRVAWNITDEGWDILGEMAEERKRPVEEVFKHAMEWQLRRPITGEIYRKPEKKAKE